MVLLATAMAVLVAGCGSNQKENQGSSQQKSDPTTNETLVGRCADNASAVGPQEEASGGEVSNGKIAFSRITGDPTLPNSDIYVIDEEGTHETPLTHTAQLFEAVPVWSPDGQKIAFVILEQSALYVMNADGTNQTQLAEKVSRYLIPAWSPDGQQIAFTRDTRLGRSALYVINADGTNEVRLNTPIFENSKDQPQLGTPVWSPAGNKIAFASHTLTDTSAGSSSTGPGSKAVEGLTGIYLINVDGTGLCKLTSTAVDTILQFGGPVWSPDGEKIAFYDHLSAEDMGTIKDRGTMNVINADGSERKELIDAVPDEPGRAWSPDGERIAFVRQSDLYVINADGSGSRRLANATGLAAFPAWSPDGEKMAFLCPAASGAVGTDLCVINADGTEWARLTLKGHEQFVSWSSG
jgi:Tol biopolymer transport system component